MQHNPTPASAGSELATDTTEIILAPLEPNDVTGRVAADSGRGARRLHLLGGTLAAILSLGAGLVMLEGDPGREGSIGLQYDDDGAPSGALVPPDEGSVAAAGPRLVATPAPQDPMDAASVENWTGAVASAFVSGWAQGQSPPGHLASCRLVQSHATHASYRCTSRGHTDSTRQIIDPTWTFSVEHSLSISLLDRSASAVAVRREDPRQGQLDAFHVWLFLTARVVPPERDCLARLAIDPVCQRAATDPENAAAWMATNPTELDRPDMAVDPLVFS